MAVETSVKQMALTRNSEFMDRIVAMLAYVATSVLGESGETPYHQGRAVYAQRVVSSPVTAANIGAPQIVMGVNVVNTTTYDEETKTSTSTITDLDLQSQIQTLWNALAGLDTPS